MSAFFSLFSVRSSTHGKKKKQCALLLVISKTRNFIFVSLALLMSFPHIHQHQQRRWENAHLEIRKLKWHRMVSSLVFTALVLIAMLSIDILVFLLPKCTSKAVKSRNEFFSSQMFLLIISPFTTRCKCSLDIFLLYRNFTRMSIYFTIVYLV